jgi:tRNA A37 methylthiotransferase MiaB
VAEVRSVRRAVEVNLVSQDTIAYGRDLKTARTSRGFARAARVDDLARLRVFYLYPER